VKTLVLSLLLLTALEPVQRPQTFTGSITDSMCATGDHSQMKMGPTSAECTIACVDSHGASFVLYDGKAAYNLSDQKISEKFAGKKVSVTGTLDASTKTIRIASMIESK
jgi:hypothetical protein